MFPSAIMPVVRIVEVDGVRYASVQSASGALTRNCGVMLTGLGILCGAKRTHVLDICEAIKKETGEEWKWKPRRSPVFVEANFAHKVLLYFHQTKRTKASFRSLVIFKRFEFLSYADYVKAIVHQNLSNF